MSDHLLRNPLARTSNAKIQATLRRHSLLRVENPDINDAGALNLIMYLERLTNGGGTTMPLYENAAVEGTEDIHKPIPVTQF